MAVLRNARGDLGVEVSPLLPSVYGPRDAYRVRCWRDSEEVLSRVYRVGGQDGHYPIRQVSRAFGYAPRLLNQTLDVALGDVRDQEDNEPAFLVVGPPWMQVQMQGVYLGPVEVGVNGVGVQWLFAPRRPRYRGMYHWHCFWTSVGVAEAAKFGEDLWAELQLAQHRRAELGLRHPTDFDDLEFLPNA